MHTYISTTPPIRNYLLGTKLTPEIVVFVGGVLAPDPVQLVIQRL